ncbi:glycosyltransferase [Micromonospora sp. KC207]|uniref:glycosyltransferase n=1 Tax=Micromonospora sp. KC207 TaxID=2530377 RepID=UPI0010454056|nr:glycosyltransferase [Micromonospora sp. KC207]TDC66481.1 glycosyltransferase [Micromonospora sp. KC207]
MTQTADRADWVAIVGPFRFPWGQASSRRVHGIACSLAAAGRHVVVACGEHGPGLTPLPEAVGPGSVSYLGMGEIPPVGAGKIDKAVRAWWSWGARTVRWLDSRPTRPSHVVLYNGDAPYAARLRNWCRRNAVPVIADVVDRYSPEQLRGGRFAPPYLSALLAFRYHYPRCAGVIAVSSYLSDHFRGYGLPVLRVPPTLNACGLAGLADSRPDEGDAVRLVYAGDPGRKDLVATIVRAVRQVNGAGCRVELRVVGPTVERVRELLGGEPVPAGVRVLGRLPQQEVWAEVREADFSVLLRPPTRFNRAGFPTKFGESLANGTPVIANLTSDLGEYLTDGVEGLVCPDHSVDGLVETLHRALRLSVEDRCLMRKAARRRALEAFDFRIYARALTDFLDSVRH